MQVAASGLVFALALAAQAAPPVAFVADIKGNATIEGNGRLTFLAELVQGTRLMLGSGASAAVTFAATGAEFNLAGPGEFLVTAAEVKAEKGSSPRRRAVASLPDPAVIARASQTATASLRMRSVTPAGASGKPVLEYPVRTRVVTLQPVHRWRGDGVAGPHTLVLTDASGNEIWKGSAQPEGTRSAVPLSPGMRYTWRVNSASGSVGEGEYETASSQVIAQVESSRARARSFSERVLHALLLEGVGASQDARGAWAALAQERPDLPEAAVLAR